MSPKSRGPSAAVTAFLVVVLTMATAPGCKSSQDAPGEAGNPLAGDVAIGATNTTIPAPSFSLSDLAGNRVELDQFKGKVLVIDFWATWCPPCREAIPELIAMKKKYGPQGFDIVGISMDENPARVVPPFVEHYGINYPVVAANAEVASAFGGIYGLPTTFVVDRHGNIAQRYIGYVDAKVIARDVEALL
ncbi:MAG: TlpA disulfide reductase family protein [Nitrospirota bacterium]|jgi:thiol-disulfide isomerase/thioredoxin